MRKIMPCLLFIVITFNFLFSATLFAEIDYVLEMSGKAIFQNSLMLDVDNEERITFYINQYSFEKLIIENLNQNLPKVIRKYYISFVYFNVNNGEICIRNATCDGVEVKIKIIYQEMITIYKRNVFSVREKNE